jgi:hypothetical protein
MHISKITLAIVVLLIVATTIITTGTIGKADAKDVEPVQSKFTHRQEVWRFALEWCESGGDPSKINPKDLDGTQSFYSFQFKPGTLKRYGEKYGLIEKDLSDEIIMEKLKGYELQKDIVGEMMNDPGINWRREFPGCVKKLGLPPKN